MRIVINALSARLGGGQTYVSNLLESLPEQLDAEIFILAPDSLSLPSRQKKSRENSCELAGRESVRPCDLGKVVLVTAVEAPRRGRAFLPGWNRRCARSGGMQDRDYVSQHDSIQPRSSGGATGLGTMRIRNWLLERAMTRSMASGGLRDFHIGFRAQSRGEKNAAVAGEDDCYPAWRRSRVSQEPGARPEWLPADNYILYVSILDVYKAQLEVVRAFALLKARRPTTEKLILRGPTVRSTRALCETKSSAWDCGMMF